jgi:hypothetical protein
MLCFVEEHSWKLQNIEIPSFRQLKQKYRSECIEGSINVIVVSTAISLKKYRSLDLTMPSSSCSASYNNYFSLNNLLGLGQEGDSADHLANAIFYN